MHLEASAKQLRKTGCSISFDCLEKICYHTLNYLFIKYIFWLRNIKYIEQQLYGPNCNQVLHKYQYSRKCIFLKHHLLLFIWFLIQISSQSHQKLFMHLMQSFNFMRDVWISNFNTFVEKENKYMLYLMMQENAYIDAESVVLQKKS